MNGTISFPTGEGMQGVNVVLQRQTWSGPHARGVVRRLLRQRVPIPAEWGKPGYGPASGMAASMGSTSGQLQGFYNLGWIPEIDPPGTSNGAMLAVVTTEPINPLYTGEYSVGPYVAAKRLAFGSRRERTRRTTGWCLTSTVG